ncbi:hypothetical protein PspTeo4_18560 [Pseudomonas sp. Teo4]|nr:hypothetical protein [Pseudomonas sp. Teo4]
MITRSTSISLIVHTGFKSFEAVGLITVFDCANRYCKSKGIDHHYELTTHSENGGLIKSDSIVTLDTQPLSSSIPDTCLIIGSPEISESLAHNAQTVNWLRRHAAKVRRCAGLCTGAFFSGRSRTAQESKGNHALALRACHGRTLSRNRRPTGFNFYPGRKSLDVCRGQRRDRPMPSLCRAGLRTRGCTLRGPRTGYLPQKTWRTVPVRW